MRACVCLRGDEGVMNKICLNQGEMYVNLGICNTSPARRTHAFMCSMTPPPPLTHPYSPTLPNFYYQKHILGRIALTLVTCIVSVYCIASAAPPA